MTLKILVVDDDVMLLKAVARGFRLSGYEVHMAGSPAEALKIFADGTRFAVVISDLEMPGMHGDEFCREVQKIAPTPFILQSGHASVTRRAIDCGASYGFMKPINPSELREAVAKLIADRQQHP